MPKFETKDTVIGYFWAVTWKWFCRIWNQHQICSTAKFHEKTKIPLDIFELDFSKNHCHIWNQHLGICLIKEFRQKTKMPKFESKIAFLGIFELNIVIFEISTLESFKNKLLTHKVNFGAGPAFPKFQVVGLGLLYKVCLFKQNKCFLRTALRLSRSCQLS